MRLTIESTGTVTTIDGVPVRLWEGRTDSGRPVRVFVHRLIADDPRAQEELDAALQVMDEPAEMAAERAKLASLLWRNAL